ncbi:hypothetical protein CMQ_4052 [Grosmannia clavigera kw1407]|uniref:Uncharacterized protein n=1 Tax=Grosmannia clavigera (strain kw1407 / UAMH 11150) TaxID=655863 RepID=F0X9K0_GROCL|nr:uncharacterized protein CMQ_4052 [Grosmannia clavigera kw1407]EFX05983.1 hypothetical protein CMQ_4052 [Grosmannia clavigera kw1407]
MPSSIPYDPSLVLANIVHPDKIANHLAMAQIQASADEQQDHLNALIASKRSLDMTRSQLVNIKVDTKTIDSKMEAMNAEIDKVATGYCAERIKAEEDLVSCRKKMSAVNTTPESPVDFVKTDIKTMPLAADSLSMDVQYFSFDINMQSSDEHATAVSDAVWASVSKLGNDAAYTMSHAVQSQVSKQTSVHDISGTLVFTVTCTHKNASLLAPLIINVDKGIAAWNELHEMTKEMHIVSGVTYGSSFVGMVHVLKMENTSASESLSSIAQTLQAQMDAGAWFAKASGGFGVNDSFSNDVKNLLSSQNVSSHVTVVSMGVIPSIVANEVKIGVKEFADFDPAKNMAVSAADGARTGAQIQSMKSTQIKAAISALGDLQDGANKIIDINSLMTALEDYLKKAAEGNCGVPINYYLKILTRKMLCQMWVAKYYPGKYLEIKADDSEKIKSGNDETVPAPKEPKD